MGANINQMREKTTLLGAESVGGFMETVIKALIMDSQIIGYFIVGISGAFFIALLIAYGIRSK